MAAFTKKIKPLPTTPVVPSSVIMHHGIQKQSEVAKRKDIPQGLWEKCKNCNELIFSSRKEENLQVCPKCGYHYPLTALERIDLLTDLGSFQELDPKLESVDTLKFEGVSSYVDKLRASGIDRSFGIRQDLKVSGSFTWESRSLYYTVREPYPSHSTDANLVFGSIREGEPIRITSCMPENGVIFSDGMEQDYLEFKSGAVATVGVAERVGNLVV